MQKSVYRVRSKVCLEGRYCPGYAPRIRAAGRDPTTQALHQARRGARDPDLYYSVEISRARSMKMGLRRRERLAAAANCRL